MSTNGSAVFAYIIGTVTKGYKLSGCVPWVVDGRVLFGPCKKKMRPEVRRGDYLVGISKAGPERRILLFMRIAERISFAKAYERGNHDRRFSKARRHAIHVKPKIGVQFEPGSPGCYRHISGAAHPGKWREDIRGKRDVFLVGDTQSWVAEAHSPAISKRLLALLRKGIRWPGKATLKNPLTENARGKHARITGRAAEELVKLIRKPVHTVRNSRSREVTCAGKCRCG